jgi:hypothetical protein
MTSPTPEALACHPNKSTVNGSDGVLEEASGKFAQTLRTRPVTGKDDPPAAYVNSLPYLVGKHRPLPILRGRTIAGVVAVFSCIARRG